MSQGQGNSRFQDHFAVVAGGYARFRPSYPAALFAWLASLAPSRQRAWDCATGSGQSALALARHFQLVLATDASAAQLAQAQPHPRVRYRQATAEQPGLEERSIDLITVAQALHWFDREQFYREAARVLVQGGILAAWTYGSASVDGGGIDAVLTQFQDHVVGPHWPPERVLVDEAYRTIRLPFEAVPAPAFVMEACWSLEQLLGYFGSWSATARYRASRGSDPLEQLRPALAAIWGEAGCRRRLRWPLTVKVSKAP
ncbi:MAG: SAM-dependent methyltransferase [Cyanobium sp. CACIAM 14]|nr:MAG: SAM-dependent methyltransferase [Cyanobium sp. CACIAM 14]